jgi:hypothetical protein
MFKLAVHSSVSRISSRPDSNRSAQTLCIYERFIWTYCRFRGKREPSGCLSHPPSHGLAVHAVEQNTMHCFEAFDGRFPEVNRLAVPATIADEENQIFSLVGVERRGELDLPEIRPRVHELHGVDVAIGPLPDLSRNANSRLRAGVQTADDQLLFGYQFSLNKDGSPALTERQCLGVLQELLACRASSGKLEGKPGKQALTSTVTPATYLSLLHRWSYIRIGNRCKSRFVSHFS